jgi:hypothetical protein
VVKSPSAARPGESCAAAGGEISLLTNYQCTSAGLVLA